jgi:hypothetical protein
MPAKGPAHQARYGRAKRVRVPASGTIDERLAPIGFATPDQAARLQPFEQGHDGCVNHGPAAGQRFSQLTRRGLARVEQGSQDIGFGVWDSGAASHG